MLSNHELIEKEKSCDKSEKENKSYKHVLTYSHVSPDFTFLSGCFKKAKQKSSREYCCHC